MKIGLYFNSALFFSYILNDIFDFSTSLKYICAAVLEKRENFEKDRILIKSVIIASIIYRVQFIPLGPCTANQ